MDSGPIFHFPHHCGIGDFRGFVSISHTVTARLFTKLGIMTATDMVINPQQFGTAPANIRIRINPAIQIGISDHFWLKFLHWQRFALSEDSLVCNFFTIGAEKLY